MGTYIQNVTFLALVVRALSWYNVISLQALFYVYKGWILINSFLAVTYIIYETVFLAFLILALL